MPLTIPKYKKTFSAFHTVYRLITTADSIKNFSLGICRLYRNAFQADKIVLVVKNIDSQGFMKIKIEGNSQQVKKGGVSILNSIEREILKQEKAIVLAKRLIYPFVFFDSMGAIYIKRPTCSDIFNDTEIKWFVALSEEIAICLKVYTLYREEQRIMINYIKYVTKMLDQFMPTSSLNTKSTLRLIKAVAKEIKLSELETKSLENATLLHDAGKIQLPSNILKKQKPLTDEEFKLVMKHPRKGIEMIKNMDLLKPTIPIILHHHERYDGKGYPSKLRKEQIPIGSRILAVLDAFDAMYFGRPYRKRKPLKEIEEELKKEKGKQFDPKIIDDFLKVLHRKDIKKHLQNSF